MQILFEASTKKYINTMRVFQEALIVTGNFTPFQAQIIFCGGKLNKYRGGFIIPDTRKVETEAIQIQETKIEIDPETEKPIEVPIIRKLIDECEIKSVTDPTPEQTMKRVGRNYLGEELSKYIVVSIPNDTYLSMETEIRQAKDIQLGDLPEQSTDGSYPYQNGMLTVIPPNPPTPEKLAKEQAEKDRRINLANAINDIKNAPASPTQEQKTDMMWERVKNEIGQ